MSGNVYAPIDQTGQVKLIVKFSLLPACVFVDATKFSLYMAFCTVCIFKILKILIIIVVKILKLFFFYHNGITSSYFENHGTGI